MTEYLKITPRDPLVARDGRPFGAGSGRRMRSTGWLTPSVAAGSFRTALGRAAGRDFDAATQESLLRIAFAGVLPLAGNELLLPAPLDCVIERQKGDRLCPHRVRPLEAAGGCDLPEGLRPVLLPEGVAEFKPEKGPAFWPTSTYVRWLRGDGIDLSALGMVRAARQDLREHVEVDSETGTAQDGMLFTTGGIAVGALPRFRDAAQAFSDRFVETTLSARVDDLPPWSAGLDAWHPLGGERRLAHWKLGANATPWSCPGDIREALTRTTKVTMTLVTPACFAAGWRPPATVGGVALKLVGACIGRWQAISGWSYAARGPKAIRRVVPAGGTYFFTVDRPGDAAALADVWLRPVSDDGQDCRDGFGLAVWGTWEGGE